MTDTKNLIREIQEHTAAHGGEDTATHLLVQAVIALQHQADELAAIGAGGVSGPLLGRAALAAQAPQPAIPAPPECVTDAEKKAYAFGWWKALESNRVQAPQQAAPADPWLAALQIRMAQGWKLKGDRVPVLYTDTINGDGVCRDDLWLCTTSALAAAPQQEVQEPVYPPLPSADKVMTPSNSEPYALWGLMRLMDYAKAYHAANASQPAPSGDTAMLDWMDADGGKQVFHFGTAWYTRDNYGLPHRKQKNLRDAIAAARKEGK